MNPILLLLLVHAALGNAAPGPSAAAPLERSSQMAAIERIELRSDDLVFTARAAGPEDGPLVLLLHGFPQTSFAFRHQLEFLGANGFRAVAPDQRGYSPGARPEDVASYAMSHLSQDVVRFADALGAEPFHLVGHDWGGAVAWVAATRFPNRVRSLSVLSTPHYAALSAQRSRAGSDQARRSSYFQDFAASGAEERLLANGAASLKAIYGDLPSEAVGTYLEVLGDRATLRAALAWYAAAFGGSSNQPTPNPPAAPAPVRVPTLYVWSDQDGAFGPEAAEATADFVSAPYRFEVVEGVDHWLPERAPALVSRLILDHLRGLEPSTLGSQARALARVRAARRSLGGEALNGFQSLSGRITGRSTNRGQTPSVTVQALETEWTGRFAFDRQGRVWLDLNGTNPGGTDRSYRRVLNGDDGWNLWKPREIVTPVTGAEAARLSADPTSNLSLSFPHALVLEALSNPASLRSRGVPPSVSSATPDWASITFSRPNGHAITLYLDEDDRPSRAEWVVQDPLDGPTTQRVDFSGYGSVEGLQVPRTVDYWVGEERTGAFEFGDLAPGTALADSLLAAPAPPTAQPPAFSPQGLADGVHALRLYTGTSNTYNVLLVELDSGVVVVEPAISPLFAPAVRRTAAGLAGGKDVRWVVATHHHTDHVAGALGYLAGGSTVLTTGDGAATVERMARGHDRPDLPASWRDSVRAVDDRAVLGGGGRTVEILSVPGGGHAAEMLVVYVPHARTLYVADLFAIPESGTGIEERRTEAFARLLDELNLDVDVIVPTHGRVGSLEDLARGKGAGGGV